MPMAITPNLNGDSVKTEFTISDTFYFNRYTKNGMPQYDNGKIVIYGNVIRIERTVEKETYFINETKYHEYEQVYEFTADNGTVVLDVSDKTLTVGDLVFHINSEIKSNW